MPCILTTVHSACALVITCQRLGLQPPKEGCVQLAHVEASGWIVHLPGLYAPLVCDTLTGLVAYHPRDNTFVPYGRIMRFTPALLRCRCRIAAQLHHGHSPTEQLQSPASFGGSGTSRAR